jgi:hypothetical protein
MPSVSGEIAGWVPKFRQVNRASPPPLNFSRLRVRVAERRSCGVGTWPAPLWGGRNVRPAMQLPFTKEQFFNLFAAYNEALWPALIALWIMMVAIGFGATAFGKRFRLYSIATMVILVVFGVLTGVDAPRVQANLPTPWLGVWERISIAVDMLWVAVLAITLLRVQGTTAVVGRQGARAA